jgi:hypothetical protein
MRQNPSAPRRRFTALDVCGLTNADGPIYQSFGRDYQRSTIANALHEPRQTRPATACPCAPLQNRLQEHGPLHRLRHRHRGGATYHGRRNGRVVTLRPIREVSTQLPPMRKTSDRADPTAVAWALGNDLGALRSDRPCAEFSMVTSR